MPENNATSKEILYWFEFCTTAMTDLDNYLQKTRKFISEWEDKNTGEYDGKFKLSVTEKLKVRHVTSECVSNRTCIDFLTKNCLVTILSVDNLTFHDDMGKIRRHIFKIMKGDT